MSSHVATDDLFLTSRRYVRPKDLGGLINCFNGSTAKPFCQGTDAKASCDQGVCRCGQKRRRSGLEVAMLPKCGPIDNNKGLQRRTYELQKDSQKGCGMLWAYESGEELLSSPQPMNKCRHGAIG